MNNISNDNNYQFINGGNDKNSQGKNNLNTTLTNKTPIKLKKINMNKKYGYGKNYLSNTFTDKKENQLNSFYYINNKSIKSDNYNNTELSNKQFNNEESTIVNLKEEIEKLKRENLCQDKLINDMKQQLEDVKKENDKKISNGIFTMVKKNNSEKLKQELGIKNNKFYEEDINYNSNIISKNNFNNKDESNLFDKLKMNYSNNKNLITELLNENHLLQKKINERKTLYGNKIRNYSYLLNKQKKELSFNILSKSNTKKFNHNINGNSNNINYKNVEPDIISNYIENSLKSPNSSFNFTKEKMIDIEQKNNVKLMIKMTLNSNDFSEDEIISLFMNNLLNYINSIEIFLEKYMRIENLIDKEMLQNYFKSLCFDDNGKFNINNIFNEIKEFYDEETKNLQNCQINELISQKKNAFIQIVKECQFIDTLKTGLIEINQFKNILDKYQFYQLFSNKNENKLFNLLLYNMKKNINKEKVGLFHLFYYNLCDNLELKDSFIKESSSNNCSIIDRIEREKKTSLFHKEHEEKEVKETVDESLNRRIISNVDFKNNINSKERGSDNSSCTYALLSSQKFSFDYSSKSGSKEAGYLKEDIKEVIPKYMESYEYIEVLCKDYVDYIFNICMEEVKRKKSINNSKEFIKYKISV